MNEPRKIIMVVDDNIANLKVAKNALSQTYDVFTVPSAAKMFDMLERNRPSLILLDIDMPEMDGFQALSAIKGDDALRNIPVIFLTARGDPENEMKGLEMGIIDCISKPFIPQLLLKRVDLHMTAEAQEKRLEEQSAQLERQAAEIKQLAMDLRRLTEEKAIEAAKPQNAAP